MAPKEIWWEVNPNLGSNCSLVSAEKRKLSFPLPSLALFFFLLAEVLGRQTEQVMMDRQILLIYYCFLATFALY